MAKKTKNEFDGLTVDELKARRDECQRSIDELLGKRRKLDDKPITVPLWSTVQYEIWQVAYR